jgi:anthranilate synthase component 1
LLKDPKEIAEHVMLVDLGRNDIGRVCKSGTVRVDELMMIELYSHVMHIVSNVVGELAPAKRPGIYSKLAFQLEPSAAHPKSGRWKLFMTSNNVVAALIRVLMVITILKGSSIVRSLFVQWWFATILLASAGAGLVADSDPDKEYEETLNKARGL